MAQANEAADTQLYMVRLIIDAPALFRLGKVKGLPVREVDQGYLVHCFLYDVFREAAPKPFLVAPASTRRVSVLAYSQRDALELRRAAGSDGNAGSAAGLVEQLDSRPMPSQWQEGAQYAFSVRTVPSLRMARASSKHRRGAEVDAFLAECWRAGDGVPVDREEVYRGWLRVRLQDRGAELEHVELKRFRISRLLRRAQGASRSSRRCPSPDATFAGRLRVSDGGAFGQLVASGLGRHKAFGYGMLLLRRAR